MRGDRIGRDGALSPPQFLDVATSQYLLVCKKNSTREWCTGPCIQLKKKIIWFYKTLVYVNIYK